MTIKEAIEYSEQAVRLLTKLHYDKQGKAVVLGIEALKRLQDNRRDPEFGHYVPLPGETEEVSAIQKGMSER